MAKRYQPADLSKLKTYSIGKRAHKFELAGKASLAGEGASFAQWWESLPKFLGASALRSVVSAIVAARAADRPVIWALGAHVVKVGCGPIVTDLIERGVVTAIAMNGATAIHDVEVAMHGETSEEVGQTIRDGSFGMVRETPAFFADAIGQAKPGEGLGAVLGRRLVEGKSPHAEMCILAACHRCGIPAMVHVAVGTDTIHMHASLADGRLAMLSADDFRLACSVVADMAPVSTGQASGVWCNVGSAVVLPEVFLKAVAVARNLGANLDDIVTANLDMIRHYRPSENVIGRPVKKGHGHQITGPHEVMLPLLRQALIETMGAGKSERGSK